MVYIPLIFLTNNCLTTYVKCCKIDVKNFEWERKIMAKAFVENINGAPTLVINDKPYFGNAITIANNRDGELKLDEEYLKNLGQSGIKIFSLI